MEVDRLDVLAGELSALALKRAKLPGEAASTLLTAAFAIMVATVGKEKAVAALHLAVERLVTRVAH